MAITRREQAIDLIESALKVNGYNLIPNLKSFKISDLFEIYQEKFGLKYNIGTPRVSEKLHEMMISKEESYRTYYNKEDNNYYMHYKNTLPIQNEFEFTSDKVVVTKDELHKVLENFNFFKSW